MRLPLWIGAVVLFGWPLLNWKSMKTKDHSGSVMLIRSGSGSSQPSVRTTTIPPVKSYGHARSALIRALRAIGAWGAQTVPQVSIVLRHPNKSSRVSFQEVCSTTLGSRVTCTRRLITARLLDDRTWPAAASSTGTAVLDPLLPVVNACYVASGSSRIGAVEAQTVRK